MDNFHLALQFLLQLGVILLCCRAVGAIAGRLGQPQVVAEMMAGVLLGPSVFGALWPAGQHALFPWDPTQKARDSQSYLFPASELGLALYMFVVGMEFRFEVVRRHWFSAVAVSTAGMIAPFVLGAALGWYFFSHTPLFTAKTSLVEGMLFLGASMCITAFPMLARIIQFKKLTGTRLGSVALGAGALDDAGAWCLLALVLASFDRSWGQAVWTFGGGLVYVALVLGVLRPVLARFQAAIFGRDTIGETGLAVALALVAFGAWWTDFIRLHAVFGAFIMGAAIPRGRVTDELLARLAPLTTTLLLPLFFTYSGLNTRLGLLDSVWLWLLATAVVAAGILGKGVACWLAARATGIPHREALGIGTLMNARGLMELIIINIGLQRGLITPGLFGMLVLLALVTTLMASPLFELLARGPLAGRDEGAAEASPVQT